MSLPGSALKSPAALGGRVVLGALVGDAATPADDEGEPELARRPSTEGRDIGTDQV